MKKKVLFVNGHVNVGGVEKSLVNILCHLDYDKYDVDLLLLEDRGDYIKDVPPEVNIIFRGLTNTYGSIIDSLKRCLGARDWLAFYMRIIFLLKKIFNNRFLGLARRPLLGNVVYDCAIGYRPGLCSDLVAYAVKAKKKITWWHHGELNMDAVQLIDYKQACNFFQNIVAVSDGCADMLMQAIPSIATRVIVIPNMIDIPSVRDKADLFYPYQQKVGWRFVTVGRLFPEKHVENAVYAAELLIRDGLKDFCWHIVGDGVEREKIEKLIREKELVHMFSFEGVQLNPYPYIKDADIYIHTSYVESQGLTIIEAMALGVPCIATRSIGPESYICNGDNGILVDQNAESLARAILDVTRSPDVYAALQNNTFCPEDFMPEIIIKKIDEVINN